ncbi:MAG: DEAD/DEAH box helicase [Dehalococcoidia bacterium]
MTSQRFLELGLSSRVLRALDTMGFEEPTPVQERVIPLLLTGRDVIVQAQTGTGKTAAYGIPVVEGVDPLEPQVQALILSPTRELALQVSVHLSQIGQYQGLNVLPVYGGQSYDHQLRALRRGTHIVVATPGRLLDLLNRRALTLDNLRYLVLDEADEMLALGFQEDVERILAQAPAERQTSLFSATMAAGIIRLSASYLRQPERVILSQPKSITSPGVKQSFYVVPRPFKVEALTQLMDMASPQLALVFCATKQMTADLAQELQSRGYRAEALHGDMTQWQRENVMKAIREGRVEVLAATDVAARGLDVPEVSHVFNFDIPQDSDRYVHRIGRTARAGRSGEAITIVTAREVSLLRAIERTVGTGIERKELPGVAELEERDRAGLAAQVEQLLLADGWSGFRTLVNDLAQRHDPLDVAAAALSHAFGPPKPRQEVPRVTDHSPAKRTPSHRPSGRNAPSHRPGRAPGNFPPRTGKKKPPGKSNRRAT